MERLYDLAFVGAPRGAEVQVTLWEDEDGFHVVNRYRSDEGAIFMREATDRCKLIDAAKLASEAPYMPEEAPHGEARIVFHGFANVHKVVDHYCATLVGLKAMMDIKGGMRLGRCPHEPATIHVLDGEGNIVWHMELQVASQSEFSEPTKLQALIRTKYPWYADVPTTQCIHASEDEEDN